MNKRGTDNLYADNYFYSSVSGELATSTATSSSVYYARVDDGSFIQYTFSNNSWIAYDKNGTKYTYGAASSTQLYDTGGNPTKVFRWMLQEARDSNDNYITYTYTRDQNQLYPDTITYTGHASTAGLMTVSFTLASSTVPNLSYKSAFAVYTNRQVSQVQASVNGSWVRRYALSYGVGANGSRPLLTSVQETGQDSNNNQITLPATSFSYASSSVSWVYNAANRGYALPNQAYIARPTSGNALNDQAVFRLSVSSTKDGYINGSSIGTVPETWAESSTPAQATEDGTRFVDINGDGIPDLVRGQNSLMGSSTTEIYLNTSTTTGAYNSWSLTATSSSLVPYFALQDFGGNQYTGGLLGNLNGDGYPDYAMTQVAIGSSTSYLGNGQGWTQTSNFSGVQHMPDNSGTPATNSQLVDINGDGLDDWVYTDLTKTYFCLNTGTGWDGSCNSAWTLATSTLWDLHAGAYADRGMRFMDANGDGLPDLLRYYDASALSGGTNAEPGVAKQLFLNTGSGWATSTVSSWMQPIATASSLGQLSFNELADWNGDGLPDQQQYYNQASKQDVLTKVTYPRGGNTQITYKFIPQVATSTNPLVGVPVFVVTRLLTSDNNSHATQYDYAYTGGKLYLANGPIDRKFAGFYTITETGPLATTVTYYSQGDTASTTVGERTDGYGQIGHAFREDVSSAGGTLLKRTFYQWNAANSGNHSLVTLDHQLIQDFDSTGSTHQDHAIAYQHATTTGNLFETDDYGVVNGSADGTYTDIGSDTRIASSTYAHNPSINLSLPIATSQLSASSTKLTETRYTYDTLAYGAVSLGNATKEEHWISGTTYASTTRAYNGYGLVTTSTDPRGNQTSYSYDSYNFYPATVTNALSQATSYTYDYPTGKVVQTTDPNTLSTKNIYDAIGRLTEFDEPDFNSPGTLVPKKTISYTDNAFPSYQATTNYLAAATSSAVYEYFDGLGRSIQKRAQAPGTNTYTVLDSMYGSNGLLTKDTLPYFASSTANTAATSTSALYTNYTYDALGRVLSIQTSVGTTTNVYGAWKVFKTDANGNTTEYDYDAWKNLTNVVDPVSAAFPSSGVVGYWKLDESSGNAVDATGNGYTLTNTGTTTYASGLLNNSADFGSANTTKMLSVASNLGINGGTVTLSGWVNVNTALSGGTNAQYSLLTLQSMQSGTTNTIYQIVYEYNSGSPRLQFGRRTPGAAGNDSQAFYGVTLTPGTWYHVTLTYDGSTLRGYLNGSQVTSTSASGNGSINLSNCFQLGSRGDNCTVNSANTASVKMDEVGVWNRALSGQEVSALYNSGAGTAYGSTGGGGQTVYTYDAVNDLTKVTDALSNIRNFTYDGLSRELTAEDLHASTTASFGTTTLSYDLAGNLASRVTPNNKTINYTYDALNRPLTEDDTSQAGTEVTNTYDSCTNGIGYLCVASTTASRVANAYNVLGLVSSTTNTIAGTGYGTTFSYDRQGNAVEIVYPDGNDIQYARDAMGNIQTIVNKAPGGSSFSSIISNTMYAPTNNVSERFYANGLEALYGYDANAQYRLTTLQTSVPTTTASTTAAVYATGLVSYWKLDESSGNAIDSSGNGNTLTNNNTVGYASALINNGADYGAGNANKYFSASNSMSWNSGAYSVSTWAKMRSAPASGAAYQLFATEENTHNTRFDAWYANSGGTLQIEGRRATPCNAGGEADLIYNVNLGTSAWHQVALTYNGTTLTLYLDGSGVASTTASGNGSCGLSNDFQLGTNAGAGANYASIYQDETGVWSRGLSSSEVSTLYNGGAGYAYPTGTVPPHKLQSIAYTYDNNGNMLQMTDTSFSDAAKTTGFGYDRVNRLTTASTTAASSTPYSQTFNYNAIGDITGVVTNGNTSSYSYAATGYANPAAPTMIGSSSLTYDHDGNVTAYASTTYSWDWRDRPTQQFNSRAGTTTYAYDAGNSRVSQQIATTSGATTTTIVTVYPNKFYSKITTTIGATSTATSTDYLFAGDTLVATVDRVFVNGSATGTPTVRYFHPDHLNSTGVVTDSSANLVQTLDYYPYGATRINTQVNNTNAARQYIGQFTDSSNLSYLNARYYDGSRGQFLSQDPVFWGDPKKQDLMNPQSLNSYSYAVDNPISKSDPSGLWYQEFLTGHQSWPSFYGEIGGAANQLAQDSSGWNFALNHPYTTGAITAVGSIPALISGGSAISAFQMAAYPGVGGLFAAQQAFAGLVYSALTLDTTLGLAGTINNFAQSSPGTPTSIFKPAGSLALNVGPSVVGGYPGAFADAFQVAGLLNRALGNAATGLFSSSVQTRQQTTEGFNAATGGAGGGTPSNSSLWVTPSGAVVTFGGRLIAPAPDKK